MTNDRKSGVALIAGAAGFIVTMAIHPSGHMVLGPAQVGGFVRVNVITHALGIASGLLLFLGAMGLTRRLKEPEWCSLAGLAIFGFSVIAAANAAIMSGFVASSVIREIVAAGKDSAGDVWQVMLTYTHAMNQAYAQVFVVTSSIAIVLWSVVIVRGKALPSWIGVFGCIFAPLSVVALLSGYLPLDVHGFGLVALLQAIWFVSSGVQMLSSQPA